MKNLKRIASRADIEELHVGMLIYNIPQTTLPLELTTLASLNHEVLKINSIESNYVVLIRVDPLKDSAPIAKDFDRLIRDCKWWIPC